MSSNSLLIHISLKAITKSSSKSSTKPQQAPHSTPYFQSVSSCILHYLGQVKPGESVNSRQVQTKKRKYAIRAEPADVHEQEKDLQYALMIFIFVTQLCICSMN